MQILPIVKHQADRNSQVQKGRAFNAEQPAFQMKRFQEYLHSTAALEQDIQENTLRFHLNFPLEMTTPPGANSYKKLSLISLLLFGLLFI
jgi:hypothetical protein